MPSEDGTADTCSAIFRELRIAYHGTRSPVPYLDQPEDVIIRCIYCMCIVSFSFRMCFSFARLFYVPVCVDFLRALCTYNNDVPFNPSNGCPASANASKLEESGRGCARPHCHYYYYNTFLATTTTTYVQSVLSRRSPLLHTPRGERCAQSTRPLETTTPRGETQGA
ncbi:MAG: hypothetical protein GY820_29630 [Gammaproteobacteria bacterium]|nr:hypothetical protein [Gammaproteobacteria bacterium]